jgi:hypothetical protein
LVWCVDAAPVEEEAEAEPAAAAEEEEEAEAAVEAEAVAVVARPNRGKAKRTQPPAGEEEEEEAGVTRWTEAESKELMDWKAAKPRMCDSFHFSVCCVLFAREIASPLTTAVL